MGMVPSLKFECRARRKTGRSGDISIPVAVAVDVRNAIFIVSQTTIFVCALIPSPGVLKISISTLLGP